MPTLTQQRETSNATTDDQKAEALNSFFFSVFTREDTSFVPSASKKTPASFMT